MENTQTEREAILTNLEIRLFSDKETSASALAKAFDAGAKWAQSNAALPAEDVLISVIRKLDSAMAMQEGRESEEFHIPQPTANAIWTEARESAKPFLKEKP